MNQAFQLSNIVLGVCSIFLFVMYISLMRTLRRFAQEVREKPPEKSRRVLTLNEIPPIFSLPDHLGRTVNLEENAGRPTLLLFTLSTCGICQTIMPHFGDVATQYPNLRIIVIASDERRSEEEVQHLPPSISLVRSDALRKEQYMIKYVPVMMLLNRDLRIVAHDRVNSWQDFEKRLSLYEERAAGA